MVSADGEFAVYKGKKYVSSYSVLKNVVNLVSKDPTDLELGFVEEKRGSKRYYIKSVYISEIEETYSLSTKAKYKGKQVGVSRLQEDGRYVIFHGDREYCEKHGFKFLEPGVWEKAVTKEELDDIWQKKNSIIK